MNHQFNSRRPRQMDIVQGEMRFEAHDSSYVLQGNVFPNSNIYIQGSAQGSTSPAGKTFDNITKETVGSHVKRPALHNALKTHLQEGAQDRSKRSRVVVVYGLGGAGKTQLVLSYIEEYRQYYRGRFWVNAANKATADNAFRAIYTMLFEAPPQNTLTAEDIILLVRNWIEQQSGKWLLVFDNADSLDNDEDKSYIEIRNYIPQHPSVHVIITTRSSTAALMTTVPPVEVREMEEAEALKVLFQISELDKDEISLENREQAALIVKELGFLALAISLAGHYIGQTHRLKSDLKLYLLEYRQNRLRLLKREPNKVVHQYGASVLVTWETSFESLSLKSSIASNLLLFLAFLDSDDIFLDMFRIPLENISSVDNLAVNPVTAVKKGKERANDTGFPSLCESQTPSEAGEASRSLLDESTPVDHWRECLSPEKPLEHSDIEDSFEIISSFSLVRFQDYESGYSMHKLVHAWGHDRLKPDQKLKFGLSSLDFLTQLVNSCVPDPIVKHRLIRHIMANFLVVQATISASLKKGKNLKVLELLRILTTFLHDTGHPTLALQLESYILEISTLIRDSQVHVTAKALLDVHTLRAKNNVAVTLSKMKRLTEAELLKEEVVREYRAIMGPEHAETILAMSNHAATLLDQGQSQAAYLMQHEAVEKMKEIRGEDDPTTLEVMGNLAAMLDDLGRQHEAVLVRKEVLERKVRVLGDEHPATISAMNNLARSLCDLGDYDEAALMQEDVLKIRSKTLGDEHPLTILSMSNLAITLDKMGDQHRAESMQRDVLQKRREVLDEDHEDIILAMNNLASTLHHCGKLQEAVKMHREALDKRRRVQGEEHPSTIASLNNLAAILEDMGEHQDAASMKQEVLEKMRRIRGHDHPHTITAMNNWASSLQKLGKLREATSMRREVLNKRRQILGDEHPDTIKAMDYLTVTLYRSGEIQEALILSEDALEKAIRTQGMSHPITTNIRDNLAVYKVAIHQTGVLPSSTKGRFRRKLQSLFEAKKLHQPR